MTLSWMKIETSTPQKIEVMKIAEIMQCSRREAFTMCFEFWAWCDAELQDGHITGMSLDNICDAARLPKGFCHAMAAAGWLQVETDRVVVVNFMRHLGNGAKHKANGARRASKMRGKKT